MQFGGCYLGRHLGKMSEIQRGHVEREIITAEIALALDDEGDPVAVPSDRREETLRELTLVFHRPDIFQPNEEGLLEAALDGDAVRRAAREMLAASGWSG